MRLKRIHPEDPGSSVSAMEPHRIVGIQALQYGLAPRIPAQDASALLDQTLSKVWSPSALFPLGPFVPVRRQELLQVVDD
jgi:hypothetical protein